MKGKSVRSREKLDGFLFNASFRLLEILLFLFFFYNSERFQKVLVNLVVFERIPTGFHHVESTEFDTVVKNCVHIEMKGDGTQCCHECRLEQCYDLPTVLFLRLFQDCCLRFRNDGQQVVVQVHGVFRRVQHIVTRFRVQMRRKERGFDRR